MYELATEKWGAQPHYSGTVSRLGEDGFGTWWWGPKGRPITRGDELRFVSETDALFLAPATTWWMATWWIDHDEVDVYVNIGTPVVFEDDRIVSTDLDLDVVRFHDGRCLQLDRDEFEEHQVRYGYPPDVIAAAEAACAETLELVRRAEPPFDADTPRRWVDLARRSSIS
jgi:protein associated with RNAse G/E